MSNTQDNKYWRSLEQLEDSPEYREFLQREFQDGASELDPVSRRTFVKLLGASMGLAGAAACRRPEAKIIPYAKAVEDLVPGVPQFYASTLTLGGEAFGVVVEAHEGRPTKIEGNAEHPTTLGATDSLLQARVLELYDPDRSRHPHQKGTKRSWLDFDGFAQGQWKALAAKNGEGLAILSETLTSPTLVRLRAQLLKTWPSAAWYVYEPVNQDHALSGAKLAFGQAVRPSYAFDQAEVIVAVDADFLGRDEGHLRAARLYSQKRRQLEPGKMNRLYAIEANHTITGSNADHRLRLRPSQVGQFLIALAHELLLKRGLAAPAGLGDLQGALASGAGHAFDAKKPWVKALADDLMEKKGASAIVVGRGQPPAVHALAHVLNAALGNVGKTVSYTAIAEPQALEQGEQLKALTQKLDSGAVSTLLILGGNPAHTSPADLKFGERLGKAPTTIHLSLYDNETSQKSSWHLPRAHELETWSDAEAQDGTRSVAQPLILPLYEGRSDLELVAGLLGLATLKGQELVRETWSPSLGVDTERAWRKLLHDGLQKGAPALPQLTPAFQADAAAKLTLPKSDDTKLDVVFVASAKLYDGRFANLGWLQELPDPMTKLVWDNAVLVGPSTAAALGVKSKDVVKLTSRDHSIEGPIWVLPGIADKTVVLELGWGRTAGGQVALGAGFNVYPLRRSDAPWFDGGVTLTKTGATYDLVVTQDHQSMEGRPLVRETDLVSFTKRPTFAKEMVEHPPLLSLWKEHEQKGHQWGMVIDLNHCLGCNGCMVACQAENNIPVVGKDQTRRGREMHWLRIDRYFAGDVDAPETVHQPVGCMHCENAPCEQVCPVAATAHSPEGLNDIAYNRCIGTRYCANNCPYKVRRFNYLNWHENETELRGMQHNPDVTVRMRGVIEKCSYCVQRINGAKIGAKVRGVELKDGDITTACQQSCPTQAIVFGDLSDPQSRVTKLKANTRNYEMLGELNVKPRTSYLAKLRNPHPLLASNQVLASHPSSAHPAGAAPVPAKEH